jgi:hypothetical protein
MRRGRNSLRATSLAVLHARAEARARLSTNERFGLMKVMILSAAATFALGAALASSAPATAQIAHSRAALGVSTLQDLKTDVRWRGRHHHWRGRRWHHHRHWGSGAGVAAGLAAGAIIGGAIASQNAARADSAVQYCINRYRSYDVASGTYLGYDGLRHPCP